MTDTTTTRPMTAYEQQLRHTALTTAVTFAELAHGKVVKSHGDAAPMREEAIAAVLDEAVAYWQREFHGHADRSPGLAREVADGVTHDASHRALAIVTALVQRYQRG